MRTAAKINPASASGYLSGPASAGKSLPAIPVLQQRPAERKDARSMPAGTDSSALLSSFKPLYDKAGGPGAFSDAQPATVQMQGFSTGEMNIRCDAPLPARFPTGAYARENGLQNAVQEERAPQVAWPGTQHEGRGSQAAQ